LNFGIKEKMKERAFDLNAHTSQAEDGLTEFRILRVQNQRTQLGQAQWLKPRKKKRGEKKC